MTFINYQNVTLFSAWFIICIFFWFVFKFFKNIKLWKQFFTSYWRFSPVILCRTELRQDFR